VIGSPFGARSTALEVVEGHVLRGRDAIVTGAASGIGIETARALAKAGAGVALAVRDRAGPRSAASSRASADCISRTARKRHRFRPTCRTAT